VSSTSEYSVKTTLTCDRCGTSTVTDKLNRKADEGWLTLHTSELETFDLCPSCAQNFRQKFLGRKE
jgi:hypothetical protein